MELNPAWLGIIRGIAVVIIPPLLTYLGDAAHLSTVLNPATASIIAVIALSFEHYFEAEGKGALFGVATVSMNR